MKISEDQIASTVNFRSTNDRDNDGTIEFGECIQVLADKVGVLSRRCEELLDRYPKAEAANEQLKKEVEEKKELLNALYMKHQLEKQVSFQAKFDFFTKVVADTHIHIGNGCL